MFTFSCGLFIITLLVQIFVPLIPGLLFLLTFFKKLKGATLRILSRFLGIGIVSFSLFNLQFFVQTLGWGFRIGLVVVLGVLWIGSLRLYTRRTENPQSLRMAMQQSLKNLHINFGEGKIFWKQLKSEMAVQKTFFFLALLIILIFVVISGIDVFSFPTFFDDAFGNWNVPAIHIFYDGGVKFFGEISEILGRGRLGYPIHIPLYKAQIATMMGGRYEMGVNALNWLMFVGLVKLSLIRTWEKTKKGWLTVLPALLIIGLPLTFFHITDSYMEFPSAVFSILTIRGLYRYFETKERKDILLALIFGAILSFTKNDGIVVYFSSIVIAFGLCLLCTKQLLPTLKVLWTKKTNLIGLLLIFLFFFLPFLGLKSYYDLGFNQAQGETSGLGLSSTIHGEIFSVYPKLFTQLNNFNVMLFIFALAVIVFLFRRKKNTLKQRFLFLVPIVMFGVITMVFLMTENYKRVLDQTTVNRVFTVIFIVFAFYLGHLLFDDEHKELKK